MTAAQLDEKAGANERMAREAQRAAQRLRLLALRCPSILSEVLAAAERLAPQGVPPDPCISPSSVPEASTPTPSSEVSEVRRSNSVQEGQDPQEGSDLLMRPVERHAHKVSKLPMPDLKSLLRDMQPQLFTAWSLRSLQKKGARDVSREDLLRLVEYVTGVSPEQALGAGYLRTVADVGEFLRAQRAQLGQDRMLTLSLPPDWQAHGIFVIQHKDHSSGSFVVRNRFTGVEVTLRVQQGQQIWDQDHPLMLEANWSDDRAKATVQDTPTEWRLRDYFLGPQHNVTVVNALAPEDGVKQAAGEGVETPPPKRLRKTPTPAEQASGSQGPSAPLLRC
jgi:hypothetical protein